MATIDNKQLENGVQSLSDEELDQAAGGAYKLVPRINPTNPNKVKNVLKDGGTYGKIS
jgi:hypothetical protein